MKPPVEDKAFNGNKKTLINPAIAGYILIPFITIILFYTTFRHGFIQDDFYYIYRASQGFNLYDIFVGSFFSYNFYRPMTNGFYYFISYSLFNLHPAGYHLIIFILFILDGLLVYSFLRELLENTNVALFGTIFYVTRGAFFVPVFWAAAGFNELGTTLFILGSIYSYLLYVKRGKKVWYLGSIAFFILALMSKESSIILPALLLLICPYGRKKDGRWLKGILIGLIPYIAITVVYLMRWYVIRTMISTTYYTMIFEPGVALRNIGFYLLNIFNNQVEVLVAVALIILAIVQYKNMRAISFMAAWSCVCILPYIFLENMHYAYYMSVSMLGIAAIFALGLVRVLDRAPSFRFVLVPAAIVLLVLSGYLAISSQENFSSITIQENTSNNILNKLKAEFPGLPDNSLLYIKNSDFRTYAALGYGESAIKLYYGDSIHVYFENVSEGFPASYNETYYFDNSNDTLYFINRSDRGPV